jgi:hypothetical protein
MKKEVKLLLNKSINSLILSVELFNRPWDKGREQAVLILFDHSFEMLMKAAILHRGGSIKKKGELQTIGYDSALNQCKALKILTEDQAITLQTINNLRDAEQHYLTIVPEQQLYLCAQSGFTTFRDVYKTIFNKELITALPSRVLPLSTMAPLNISTLFENNVTEISKILQSKKRCKFEAINMVRSLALMDSAIQGSNLQISQAAINKICERIKCGTNWESIFPGVASITISSDGQGQSFGLRISKSGVPVTLVPLGTPGATIIADRKTDSMSYFTLSFKNLSDKVNLTGPKLHAILDYLNLKNDSTYCKEITVGKTKFYKYSPKTIEKIQATLESKDGIMVDIWKSYRSKISSKI